MSKPYLLLSLTSLFWAGNVVLGRFVAGKIPPMTLSFIRWSAAFLIVLPFAWKYLAKDWPAIRNQLGLMVVLSVTGIAVFNCLGYWSLQYTQALNALLLQSTGPLFVALFALVLFGIRLTLAQTIGIVISMIGVLVILLRGDVETLSSIQFNKGDIGYTLALAIFGLYSALAAKRPLIHPLSFLAFTTGCGALFIIPLIAWEIHNGQFMTVSATTMAALVYVAIFPSTLAYLFFNRGIFPFDTGVRLCAGDRVPGRTAAAVSCRRLRAGTGGGFHRRAPRFRRKQWKSGRARAADVGLFAM